MPGVVGPGGEREQGGGQDGGQEKAKRHGQGTLSISRVLPTRTAAQSRPPTRAT